MPSRVIDHFVCWEGQFGRLQNIAMLRKMAPSSLMWCLWREINDRSFEDRKLMAEELKDFKLRLSFSLDS